MTSVIETAAPTPLGMPGLEPDAVGAEATRAYLMSASPAEAFRLLGSSRRGLAPAELEARRIQHGFNELPRLGSGHLLGRFLRQFTNFFAILLLGAAGITLGAYLVQSPHDLGNLQLSAAILGVVLLNAWIGFIQEYSAERTAQALAALVPALARVVRGGERLEVAARELVPGDLVLLEAGDAVPCDCRIVEAHELAADLASLTGESQPVGRGSQAVAPGVSPLESPNLLFMGTSLAGGTARALAFATGIETEFGRIYRLTAETRAVPSPLQRQVAVMARRVALVAVAAGILIFVFRTALGAPLLGTFLFAIGVAVALVPEGLPATLSVSLAVGVRRMARRKALIKRLLAVEALGSTTVICTDKTGTLTTAEMTVQEVWASGRAWPVSGAGYLPEGTVEGGTATREVLRVAALCSNARLLPPDGISRKGWHVLGDTTEGALLVAARKAGLDEEVEGALSPRVHEFPFDSSRKLMTTIHRGQDSSLVFVKGSPQELLPRCSHVLLGGEETILSEEQLEAVVGANDAMASRALRVLAVASRRLSKPRPTRDEAESDLTLLGLVGMLDPPRDEVLAAVADATRAGIRLVMVTGDYGLTAESIGRRLGMIQSARPRIVTGADLDQMSDADLADLLRTKVEVLFARVKPEDKLRVVTAFRTIGEVVAVTGDGVNDAPALKRADIGVAMGRSGTDVAREAAQMILLDDSFASIVAAIELGRSVYQNVRKFLVYLFSHNLAELAPIVAAAAVGFPLVPLSALQILSIDLGSDILPALALGMEKPEPGLMDRPPRRPDESLFSAAMLRRLLFLGSIQSLGVIFVFFWKIHSAGLSFAAFTPSNPFYREAITMTQAGIVCAQFFNGFAVRTDFESVFKVGLLSNWRLVVGEVLGVAFVAAVSYVPLLQGLFHTAPLSAIDWALVAGFGLLLFIAEEVRKFIARARRRARVKEAQ